MFSTIILHLHNFRTENAERRKVAQQERMRLKRATTKVHNASNLNSSSVQTEDPIISNILHALVSEVPKISRKNMRKKADAEYHRLKKAAEKAPTFYFPQVSQVSQIHFLTKDTWEK